MSASMTSYLDDFSPGSGRRSRPRAWLSTDAPTLSLNGEWKFRWSPTAPGLDDAAADPDFRRFCLGHDSGALTLGASWDLR